VTKERLKAMSGVELRELADQVGVGYHELDDAQLLKKLLWEGGA